MKKHRMIRKLLHITPTKTQPTTAKLITWRKVGKEKGSNQMMYNLREKQLSGNSQKSESTDFSQLDIWLDMKKYISLKNGAHWDCGGFLFPSITDHSVKDLEWISQEKLCCTEVVVRLCVISLGDCTRISQNLSMIIMKIKMLRCNKNKQNKEVWNFFVIPF